MTTRQAVARLLHWLLDRVEPPEPTTDIVTPPLTAYTYFDFTRGTPMATPTVFAPPPTHATFTITNGATA